MDAFVLGLLDFIHVGRHLRPRAAVGDGHLLGPQPQAGPGGVDGHVAAADDDRMLSRDVPVAQGHAAQQVDRLDHLGEVGFAGDVELEGLVGPDGEEHRLEPI